MEKLVPITEEESANHKGQFRPIVKADGVWCGNSLRFATWKEANDNAYNLLMRWTVPTDSGVACG